MKPIFYPAVFIAAWLLVLPTTVPGAERSSPEPESTVEACTPQPIRILQNKGFDDSAEARRAILEMYRDLRVTDVVDGMYAIGLQDIGIMDQEIRPLWRDTDRFSHRFVGFAVTVRYVPAQLRMGQNSFADYESYKKFKSEQYGQSAEKHWVPLGKSGDK